MHYRHKTESFTHVISPVYVTFPVLLLAQILHLSCRAPELETVGLNMSVRTNSLMQKASQSKCGKSRSLTSSSSGPVSLQKKWSDVRPHVSVEMLISTLMLFVW